MTFTAVADCPECGSLDVHWLDGPMPKPTAEDIAGYEAAYADFLWNPGTPIVAWGGQVMRRVGGYASPKPLVDESVFEVMRVCRSCNYRWGQE